VKDIVDVIAGEPGPKSDITLFRKARKTLVLIKNFKEIKAYVGEASISTKKTE